MKWGLFVPTYKRKEPLILQMLDIDSKLVINLCVRHEELESGFYDHLKDNNRIELIDLGTGLKNLGDTRERIINYCKENRYDYCCMFDDCIFNVHERDSSKSIVDTLQNCIVRMASANYAEYIVGFSFVKLRYLDTKTGELKLKRNHNLKDEQYFVSYPGQAVILNVNLLSKHNINYHSLDEVGFEDAALFGDTIKAGLVWLGDIHVGIDGAVPNVPKPGGSHHDNFDVEKKYDKHNKMTYDYLNMMGVHISKQYRDYADSFISFLVWDFDYFRDVLVTHRKDNKKIIESHFSLENICTFD